jgi:hypothetical protein
MAGGLVVSTSRSGGLGAFAGCLALAVFAFRNRRLVVASALVSSAVLAVALWLIAFGPLGLLNNDPARSRLQLWPDALRMIGSRPITGWGEDVTGLALGRFISANWAPGVIYDRTHSGLLEIAATQGTVGVVALGWVLFVLFRGIWRYRLADSVAALGAACIGYTAWVLFNFDWAPATGVFWLLAGTAWSAVRAAETAGQVETESRQPRAAVRSIAALALAISGIWFGVMPVLADAWYSQGRPDLSVMVDPLQARYHWVRGLSLVGSGNVRAGVVELRAAANLGATDPQVYVDLGDAEKKLGNLAAASRAFHMALLIDPYFEPAQQRLSG